MSESSTEGGARVRIRSWMSGSLTVQTRIITSGDPFADVSGGLRVAQGTGDVSAEHRRQLLKCVAITRRTSGAASEPPVPSGM